jgi:small neutral amino acid transporter SnatA (MarC family)
MKRFLDTAFFVIEEENLSDDEFRKRNRLILIASVFFMIAGPLFIYHGFYLLTWPYTVKWGALSIALGMLILMFAFDLWQDRQVMTIRRMFRKENEELRRLIMEHMGKKG